MLLPWAYTSAVPGVRSLFDDLDLVVNGTHKQRRGVVGQEVAIFDRQLQISDGGDYGSSRFQSSP